MDEVTAEFTTEEVQKKADALEKESEDSKPSLTPEKKKGSSWIPFWVGLLTIIGMLAVALTVWAR